MDPRVIAAEQAPPVAQVAAANPWIAFRLNLQTGLAVDPVGADLLFFGLALVPEIMAGAPYVRRGMPAVMVRGNEYHER